MKQYIHINQHEIKANIKRPVEEQKPVITCKTYKSNEYYNNVKIMHEGVCVAEVKYSPNKPLSCGARVWVELNTDVTTIEGE